MDTEKLTEYFDYLSRFAESKCSTHEDAEDLVSETILRALAYVKRGGVIAHPKTWLTNTMLHIFNDSLRRKYREPVVTNLEYAESCFSADEALSKLFATDEEAEVRREVSYLSKLTRDVIIAYYFGGYSVKYISECLKIPEGTVKSRLDAGRRNIKKGIETMINTNEHNVIPAELRFAWCGQDGRVPQQIVEDSLIAQNLLLLAYNKPVTVPELSRMIGIPTAYIEPIVDKLIDAELMAKTDFGKVYTDFIIYQPKDTLRLFEKQKNFAVENFDGIWAEMEKMLSDIREMKFYGALSHNAQLKLERYTLLKALQNYFYPGRIENLDNIEYPYRSDGYRWLGFGFAYPPDYDRRAMQIVNTYRIIGGHRTVDNWYNRHTDGREVHFILHEFDVMMFDDCGKYCIGGYDNYFNGIHRLLWCVYNGITPNADDGIPTELIENIPKFIDIGYIVREDGVLKVDIPIITGEEMNSLNKIIASAVEATAEKFDEKMREFLKGTAIDIPPHLKTVPESMRYRQSTDELPMAIIHLAYEKGLHLKDVNHCLTPVVLSWTYDN